MPPGRRSVAARPVGRSAAPVIRATASSGQALPVILGQRAGYSEIASGETGNGNAMLASRWMLESRYGSSVTMTKLGAYVQNPVGSLRLGVYTDSAGAPGTLIAEATEMTSLVAGFNEANVTWTPSTNTAYWLVAHPSSNSLGIGTRTGFQVQQSRFVSRTYGALPASFPGGSSQQDLNRCIYAVGTSNTVTKPADPAAPSAPSPIAGQGYSLVFSDEFTYLDRTKWTNQVWWDGPGRPDTQYVEDGVLHCVAYESDGWPNVTMDTLGFQSFQRGYFEARMRDTGSRASFPAFWLFSDDWAKRSACGSGDRAAELDVVEIWGNQFPQVVSNTAHSDSANVCTANNQGPDDSFQDIGINTVGTWRVYGLKWETNLLTWYVDNVERNSLVIGAGTDWTTFNRPMHVIVYQWPDRGNTIDGATWPLPTSGVDPSAIHAEFDYVRVWQQ